MKTLISIFAISIYSLEAFAQFSFQDMPMLVQPKALPAAATNAVAVDTNLPPVAGYTLWLTADYGTFTNRGATAVATNGDRVGFWTDRSGNTNHAVEVGNIGGGDSRPVISNSVFNGYPALRFAFAAPNKTALASVTNNVSFSTTGMTVFAVASMEFNGDTYNAIFNFGAGTGAELRQNASSMKIQASTSTKTITFGTAYNLAPTGYCFALRFSTNAQKLSVYQNGTEAQLAPADTDALPTTNGFGIGHHYTGVVGNFWYGYIAEVVVWPFALSDGDMTTVSAFYVAKYALP